jgi:uncharacterized protein (DUF305 family)
MHDVRSKMNERDEKGMAFSPVGMTTLNIAASHNGHAGITAFLLQLCDSVDRRNGWDLAQVKFLLFDGKSNLACARGAGTVLGALLAIGAGAGLFSLRACAQKTDHVAQADAAKAPVVVQPGAPGEPSKTLPPSTRATLPPWSQANVDFMQGMIMQHAQAVEMTALIESHTENKDLRKLGARISSSQTDEIRFMKRWLMARGESISMAMHSMAMQEMPREMPPGMPEKAPTGAGDMPGEMSHHESQPEMGALMPGMLTPEQMEALRKAKGAEFDRLFLTGMIQHHNGALIMVKDLFDTAGAGQDAELFTFATDVDSGQRAEIKIMQGMLEKDSVEEKR